MKEGVRYYEARGGSHWKDFGAPVVERRGPSVAVGEYVWHGVLLVLAAVTMVLTWVVLLPMMNLLDRARHRG